MENLEQNIRQIVEEVIKGINLPQESPSISNNTGVFSNLDQAVTAADTAFKSFNQQSKIENQRNI